MIKTYISIDGSNSSTGIAIYSAKGFALHTISFQGVPIGKQLANYYARSDKMAYRVANIIKSNVPRETNIELMYECAAPKGFSSAGLWLLAGLMLKQLIQYYKNSLSITFVNCAAIKTVIGNRSSKKKYAKARAREFLQSINYTGTDKVTDDSADALMLLMLLIPDHPGIKDFLIEKEVNIDKIKTHKFSELQFNLDIYPNYKKR